MLQRLVKPSPRLAILLSEGVFHFNFSANLLILDALNDIMAVWPPSTHLAFCQVDCHKVFGNSLVVPESRIWTVPDLHRSEGFQPWKLAPRSSLYQHSPIILTAVLSGQMTRSF